MLIKTQTPSTLTRKQLNALKPETSVRIKTKSGNMFDVWKDLTVRSVSNGTTYKATDLTDAKQFIGCFL